MMLVFQDSRPEKEKKCKKEKKTFSGICQKLVTSDDSKLNIVYICLNELKFLLATQPVCLHIYKLLLA